MNELDWLKLQRAKWERFSTLANLGTCIANWQASEGILLIDCGNLSQANDLSHRLERLKTLTWIVLGSDTLSIYYGETAIFEGSTQPELESGKDFDLVESDMVATLDRERVEAIAVEQFKEQVLDPEMDAIADEAVTGYLSSSDFESYARTRFRQRIDHWRSLFGNPSNGNTATIEAEAPAQSESTSAPYKLGVNYSITLTNAIDHFLSDDKAKLDMLSQIRRGTKKGKSFLEQNILPYYPEEKRERAMQGLMKQNVIDKVKARLNK